MMKEVLPMKRILSLLLTLVLVLTLAGCGASAKGADSAASIRDADSDMMSSDENNSYWNGVSANYDTAAGNDFYDDGTPAEEPRSSESEENQTTPAPQDTKMIYTGYMELQTLDFDKASSDIDALVKQLGGYFEQNSVSNRGGSGYRHANYTIRVPAAQFEPFFQQAGALCHVTYSSADAQSITESYYDTQSRLETARIKLERLQALLAKATSMEDIITIESAISETEWDIENLSGTLRHYDALVDYATIDVELNEVYKLSGQDEAVTTFGGRLGQSFTNGLRAVGTFLEDLAVLIAYSWVWLVALAVVIVLLVRLVRYKRAGKKFSLKKHRDDAPSQNSTPPQA